MASINQIGFAQLPRPVFEIVLGYNLFEIHLLAKTELIRDDAISNYKDYFAITNFPFHAYENITWKHVLDEIERINLLMTQLFNIKKPMIEWNVEQAFPSEIILDVELPIMDNPIDQYISNIKFIESQSINISNQKLTKPMGIHTEAFKELFYLGLHHNRELFYQSILSIRFEFFMMMIRKNQIFTLNNVLKKGFGLSVKYHIVDKAIVLLGMGVDPNFTEKRMCVYSMINWAIWPERSPPRRNCQDYPPVSNCSVELAKLLIANGAVLNEKEINNLEKDSQPIGTLSTEHLPYKEILIYLRKSIEITDERKEESKENEIANKSNAYLNCEDNLKMISEKMYDPNLTLESLLKLILKKIEVENLLKQGDVTDPGTIKMKFAPKYSDEKLFILTESLLKAKVHFFARKMKDIPADHPEKNLLFHCAQLLGIRFY